MAIEGYSNKASYRPDNGFRANSNKVINRTKASDSSLDHGQKQKEWWKTICFKESQYWNEWLARSQLRNEWFQIASSNKSQIKRTVSNGSLKQSQQQNYMVTDSLLKQRQQQNTLFQIARSNITRIEEMVQNSSLQTKPAIERMVSDGSPQQYEVAICPLKLWNLNITKKF